MSKALDSGKSLIDQILAKLPESVRATVTPIFAAPEAIDALTLLGDAGLARADYSRLADEFRDKETQLTTDYEALKTWHETVKGQLDEYGRMKPEYERLKTGAPPPKEPVIPPVSGLSREDLDKILQERDAGYASVLALSTTLSAKHFKEFGDVLDMNALVAHATKNRLALYDPRAEMDAYRALHGEKLTAKAAADEKVRIDKLVAEGMAAAAKNQQQPYPVRGAEASVLDVLEQPVADRTARYTADSAAAKYDELMAGQR